jgi:hypothetical protein
MCVGFLLIAACPLPVASLLISIVVLWLSIGLLIFSRRGRIKVLNVSGGTVRGKSAKLISTVVALWLMSMSTLGILSAIFGWGCPRIQ